MELTIRASVSLDPEEYLTGSQQQRDANGVHHASTEGDPSKSGNPEGTDSPDTGGKAGKSAGSRSSDVDAKGKMASVSQWASS